MLTYCENERALENGRYFHTSRVAYQTNAGIAFPKEDGGKEWFPKKAVHVVLICQGRVDVWVDDWLIKKDDDIEYGSIEQPEVPESTLPDPTQSARPEKAVV